VTGIFGERYFLKSFIADEVLPENFDVEITRDSNTLDRTKEWRYRHSSANCVFCDRHACKFRCGPTLLVYLENAHGNSSRALRNKVPRYAHRRMRTALVCRSRQIQPPQNADVRQETKSQGESSQVIRGVMS
jgi:hypothetical protein